MPTVQKECQKHGITDWYLHRDKKTSCLKCRKEAVQRLRLVRKEQAVAYKGGKCERCGYDKFIGALEFHHLNPTQKDFGIGDSNTRSFEKMKIELDKCTLVCANCHREIHEELRRNC